MSYELDTNFSNTGKDGIVLLDLSGGVGTSNDEAYSVVVDKKDNIIVAGFSNANGSDDFAIVKLDQKGDYVESFKNDQSDISGVVLLDLFNNKDDKAYSVVVDNNDNIIIAGYCNVNSDDFAIVKLDPSGQYVQSFNNDNNKSNIPGVVLLDLMSDMNDKAYSVVVDNNDNIIVAGQSFNDWWDFAIVKLYPNGQYVETFANEQSDISGVVLLDLSGNGMSNDEAYSVCLDRSDNIIVAGYSNANDSYDFAIVKLDQNGDYVESFKNDQSDISGVVLLDLSGGSMDKAKSVFVDNNDNIIVAGYSNANDINDFAIVKLKYQSNASSSGDPYVTTFSGHKYKIPNKNNIYRMFQYFKENEKVIVNASVSQLTNSEKQQLLKISNDLGIKNPILNGYYYDKFYISYNDKYVVFNRNIEIIDTNIDKETENLYLNYDNKVKEFNCPIQGKSVYKSIFINIYNTRIELQKILHPQILNGININYSGDIREVKGIFNTNKHPKNYTIKKINSDRELKCKKEREYKRIERENWIKVN